MRPVPAEGQIAVGDLLRTCQGCKQEVHRKVSRSLRAFERQGLDPRMRSAASAAIGEDAKIAIGVALVTSDSRGLSG